MPSTHHLQNLTVLVFSYARRWRFVERTVNHWRATGASIVILDGSDSAANIEEYGFKGEKISYHHFPCSSYLERIIYSGNYVKTPYSLMHNDDDFKLKQQTCRSIELMEQNLNLASCNGEHAYFFKDSKKRAQISKPSSHKEYQYATLEQRFKAVSKFLYMDSVIRSDIYISAAKSLLYSPSSSALVFQLQLAIAAFGEVGHLHEMSWLRSNETPPAGARAGIYRTNYLVDWLHNPSTMNEASKWKADCITNLSLFTQKDYQTSYNLFKSCLDDWCSMELEQKMYDSSYLPTTKIANTLNLVFPSAYNFLWKVKNHKLNNSYSPLSTWLSNNYNLCSRSYTEINDIFPCLVNQEY